MRPKRQNVTMRDIAEATGYSVNTVSRALRNKDDIAPETRQRIQAVQEEMGYINNMIASSLRRGYTNTIAVILGDISNPHFGIMMSEIEKHAGELGYSSFLQNTRENEILEKNAIKSALNKSVDGIILCPCQKSEKNILYLKKSGKPFVLIGRWFDKIDTDYVICNDELGGYLATKELLDKGHTKILMLQGDPCISSAKERLAGYVRAHEERGREFNSQLIREGSVFGANNETIFEEIWREHIEFTAAFAFSDLIAWEFWRFLKKKGMKVPDDVSLIGFDHIQSRLPIPFELTSVSSYKGRMSLEAVDILVRKIHNQESFKKTHRVIDTKLSYGTTVKNLNLL